MNPYQELATGILTKLSVPPGGRLGWQGGERDLDTRIGRDSVWGTNSGVLFGIYQEGSGVTPRILYQLRPKSNAGSHPSET